MQGGLLNRRPRAAAGDKQLRCGGQLFKVGGLA